MLQAGVIDEVSLLLAPTVDGLIGTPAVFDIEGPESASLASHYRFELETLEQLDGGVVWLRYAVRRHD